MALLSRNLAHKMGVLRKVSDRPLVLVIDKFVDDHTLAQLQRGRQEIGMDGKAAMLQMLQDLAPKRANTPAHHTFMSMISQAFFEGQWGDNDAVRVNASSSSDANNDSSTRVSYPEGLHVDTNNNATLRSATCILYLNDIPAACGGATVFPLAGVAEDDAGLGASRALLREQCMHTRSAAAPLPSTGSVLSVSPLEGGVADPLSGVVDDETILRIQPRAGRLMIFFSRTDDGEIDPRSWHGGERLRPAHGPAGSADDDEQEKHILTLFKQVHYKGELLPWPHGCGGQSLESYLAPQIAQQRRHLAALAEQQTSQP